MSKNDDTNANNSSSVPFFARYLEGQFIEEVLEEEMDEVQGGIDVVTLKYPSDNEDNGSDHGIITKKHRFDIEDIGCGGGYLTKKYPSDKDEAVTQKFPSDGDDHVWFDKKFVK